ncbi:MAG: TOBE domain-containing protein, partial [Pseudomonadota bacterium]
QAEALTMSDQMAVMMNGQILQYGRPSHVYSAPASLEVAKFVGSPAINILPGEINGTGGLSVMGKALIPDTQLTRQPVSVGIRPEHLKLDPDGPFKGVIRHRENLGSDVFLHAQVAGLEKPVILRSHPKILAGTGLEEEVTFSGLLDEVHVFGADGQRLRVARTSLVEVA